MILLDSSALIEFYRPSGDERVRAAVGDAIAAGNVAVNGIVEVEILGFATGESERNLLESDFRAFHHLELGRPQFAQAASLGFRLRRQGLTIPATDLVIAASALDASATLYHVDRHFERIAEHSDLNERYLGVDTTY